MRSPALVLGPLAFLALSGCTQLIAYIDRPGSSPAPSIPLGTAALSVCAVEGQVTGPTGADDASARVQNWQAVSGLALRARSLTGTELGSMTTDASGRFRLSTRAIQARTLFLEGSLSRGGQTWTYRAPVRLNNGACPDGGQLRMTPATTALSLALEAGWRRSGTWVLPDDMARAVAIIESLMAPPRGPEALKNSSAIGVEMLRAMIREKPELKQALLPFVLPDDQNAGASASAGGGGAGGGGAGGGGAGGAGGGGAGGGGAGGGGAGGGGSSDPPLSGVVR